MADLVPAMPKLSTTAPGQAPSPAPARETSTVAAPRIPLQAGLVITTVSSTPDGDEEAETRITAANRDTVTVSHRAMLDGEGVEATRTLRRTDLEQASSYRHTFSGDDRPAYEGTTALGVSTRVLRQLRDAGGSALTLDVGDASPEVGSSEPDLVAELDAMLGEKSGLEDIEAAVNRQAEHGTITEGERAQGAESVGDIRRLGLATGRLRTTGRLRVPVIVNDRRVLLDAITAIGSLSNGKDDFAVSVVILDDAANPLTLRLQIGDRAMEVTRLGYAQSSLVYASQIEQALQKTCRVDVYGLGFAPGGAKLQPGSDETLSTLRTVFSRHPEWTLAVLSHGDADVSIPLSKRRADAIRDQLANEDGARLVAVELPRLAPLAGNDTIAGRALNRRTTFSRSGCPR